MALFHNTRWPILNFWCNKAWWWINVPGGGRSAWPAPVTGRVSLVSRESPALLTAQPWLVWLCHSWAWPEPADRFSACHSCGSKVPLTMASRVTKSEIYWWIYYLVAIDGHWRIVWEIRHNVPASAARIWSCTGTESCTGGGAPSWGPQRTKTTGRESTKKGNTKGMRPCLWKVKFTILDIPR